MLALTYSLEADLSAVRIPTGDRNERADDLWKHTCFECFLELAVAPSYYEMNFSPSRQWAAYRFEAYREGRSHLQLEETPEIRVTRDPQRLELAAVVRIPRLPEVPDRARAHDRLRGRLALAAVIEEHNGRLSYWAARHSPGKPDFHHSAGFILELDT